MASKKRKKRLQDVENSEPGGHQVPVAGLCATAGGLDAFKKFFSAMSADSGIAFVVLPHLDPTHESPMVELITRQTAMPVAEAADGMKVEANRVYVIPPNKYITIAGGVLRLTTSFDSRLEDKVEELEGANNDMTNLRALRDSEQRLRSLNESLEERVVERTKALRASEELMRSIVDTAAEGIIIIDEAGTISSFNKAAEQMFGYAAADALGQNVKALMPPPFHAEHDRYLANYLRTGVRKMIGIGREVVGRRKDGSTFPIDLAVSELSAGGKRLFTGIIRDISQRRALEKEVLEIASREQQRIGQDLHDSVGQEMTGLRLMAENLAESLAGPAEKKRAQRIGAGLQTALQQIRALSRGLIPVEVSPDGLMSALTDLAERVSDQSGVVCTFRCDRPVLLKDPQAATQLFRIAQEAITNALLHGRARTILVRLTSSAAEGEGEKGRMGEGEKGRKGEGEIDKQPHSVHLSSSPLLPFFLTLAVEDDGTGMPDRTLPTKGSGLKIMGYRASLINAVLDVGPGASGGTRITCTLKMGNDHEQKTKPVKKRR